MQKLSLPILIILGFASCSQSPTSPSMGTVAVTAEGMAITIQTTQPLTIDRLVVALDEESFVTGLDVLNEQGGGGAAVLLPGRKYDLAVHVRGVPEGTTTRRLYVVGGVGSVGFTTNPARDWIVRDQSGRVVQLADEALQLQLRTKVDLRVDGGDGPTVVIPLGQCVTLSWTSQEAIECHADGDDWPSGNGSEKALVGSEIVCPRTRVDYQIVCRGSGGSVYDVVFVQPD